MDARNKTIILVVFLAGMLLFGLVALSGCEKKSEPAPLKIEQTTCPVMAGPINKNIYTEYQGKKVYFCCQGCVDKFKANPQEYIAKLPQFKD